MRIDEVVDGLLDPNAEEIIGDEEASRRLDRPKREPWTL